MLKRDELLKRGIDVPDKMISEDKLITFSQYVVADVFRFQRNKETVTAKVIMGILDITLYVIAIVVFVFLILAFL